MSGPFVALVGLLFFSFLSTFLFDVETWTWSVVKQAMSALGMNVDWTFTSAMFGFARQFLVWGIRAIIIGIIVAAMFMYQSRGEDG